MHGPNPGFKPGDYWMVCDVCGFDYRRSEMSQRWDRLWVCKKDYETKHPQDFVKGVKDKQAVPVSRPDNLNLTNSTTLSVAATAGASTITVAATTYIADNDTIGITLDDGTVQWTTVDGTPVAGVVTLFAVVAGAAALGNAIYGRGTCFRTTDPTPASL